MNRPALCSRGRAPRRLLPDVSNVSNEADGGSGPMIVSASGPGPDDGDDQAPAIRNTFCNTVTLLHVRSGPGVDNGTLTMYQGIKCLKIEPGTIL